MPLIKVNETGAFQPFPGVTVIAPTQKEDRAFWDEISKVLNECEHFSEFYAPLPVDSYHMTVTNLFVDEDKGAKPFEKFIEDKRPFFQSLHTALETTLSSFEITLGSVHESGAIVLSVNLPPETQEKMKRMAKEFNLQDKVPSYFHITLAYRYKPYDLSTRDLFSTIVRTIKDRIGAVIKSHQKPIILDAPKLYFFNDMTKFTPWDGSGVIFEKALSIKRGSFFQKPIRTSSGSSISKKEPPCSIM